MANCIVKALTVLLPALGWQGVALAESNQDLSNIMAMAEDYARSQFQGERFDSLEVTAIPLDNRLKLKECLNGLEAFGTPVGERSGRATVGIRCTDQGGWTLYVPVKIEASIVVVSLVGALPRGHRLSATDLELISKPLNSLPAQYMTRLEDALDKELTRPVTANSLVTTSMLRQPVLVAKGQMLTILSAGSSFTVKMAGTALTPGSAGDRISVKNNSSGKTLQGVVVDAGTVRVNQ